MNTQLTANQIETFHQQGYLLVPSFYDRAREIEPIQRGVYDIIGLVIRRHDLKIERPSFSPEMFAAGFAELIKHDRAYGSEVYDAVKLIPAFVRLAASEKNELVVRQLCQTDRPGFISRGYGMRIDLPNEDHIRAAWHQEYLFQLRSLDGLILWSPLQPMTKALGPVVLAHASHRDGIRPVTTNGSVRGAYSWRLMNEDEIAGRYEHVSPLTDPGDLLVMDFLTVHRSGVNTTDAARWSMQMRLFNFEEPTGMEHGWPGSVADGIAFEEFHPECLAPDEECV